jgi:hypothetical protein
MQGMFAPPEKQNAFRQLDFTKPLSVTELSNINPRQMLNAPETLSPNFNLGEGFPMGVFGPKLTDTPWGIAPPKDITEPTPVVEETPQYPKGYYIAPNAEKRAWVEKNFPVNTNMGGVKDVTKMQIYSGKEPGELSKENQASLNEFYHPELQQPRIMHEKFQQSIADNSFKSEPEWYQNQLLENEKRNFQTDSNVDPIQAVQDMMTKTGLGANTEAPTVDLGAINESFGNLGTSTSTLIAALQAASERADRLFSSPSTSYNPKTGDENMNTPKAQ